MFARLHQLRDDGRSKRRGREARPGRFRRVSALASGACAIVLLLCYFAVWIGMITGAGEAKEATGAFSSTPEQRKMWDSWVKETVDKTVGGDTRAIIVDKSAYTLYLVDKGHVSLSFPVELGWSPVDDKLMEGDGATPEGFYKVTEKRDIGHTRFHRGFLINFPNKLDRDEFRDNVKLGVVPKDAGIGGLILIHGSGTGARPGEGGRNWTLGCVALSNEDIDKIFALVSVGTPVTIVRKTGFFEAQE